MYETAAAADFGDIEVVFAALPEASESRQIILNGGNLFLRGMGKFEESRSILSHVMSWHLALKDNITRLFFSRLALCSSNIRWCLKHFKIGLMLTM